VWPPADVNYEPILKKMDCRPVPKEEWRDAPEFDKTKLKKVCALEHFPGVYRTSKGEVVDARPHDSAPTLRNFQKKTVEEL